MPRLKNRVPQLCRAGDGRGYVALSGRRHYLGPYGSPQSRSSYGELLSRWEAGGRKPLESTTEQAPTAPTWSAPSAGTDTSAHAGEYLVKELVRNFLRFAQVRHAQHNRFNQFKEALRPMLALFGSTPAREFGPKKLRAVRDAHIQSGICRREVNRRIYFIRKTIAWAVAEERLPGESLHRLNALEPLRHGDGIKVKESQRIRPVAPDLVAATIPCCLPEVAAMIQLQQLTGARSGEVIAMRAAEINMAGDVWVYHPATHKNAWRGQERTIPMGPRAQAILRPFLTGKPTDYLFSPAVALARFRADVHAARVTPIGQGNRPGARTTEDPQRQPGAKYQVCAYGRAIARACVRAFPLPAHLDRRLLTPTGRKKQPRLETEAEWQVRLTPAQRQEVRAWRKAHHWHPHQLRHTAGTAVRAVFGLEKTQAFLGHESLQASQIYAEVRQQTAIEIARQVG